MTPSVPDRGSGPRSEGWATGVWWGKVPRLSTHQGANAPLCADSGPRTSACTDICALACTTNNAAEVSALRDIPILFVPRYAQRRAL